METHNIFPTLEMYFLHYCSFVYILYIYKYICFNEALYITPTESRQSCRASPQFWRHCRWESGGFAGKGWGCGCRPSNGETEHRHSAGTLWWWWVLLYPWPHLRNVRRKVCFEKKGRQQRNSTVVPKANYPHLKVRICVEQLNIRNIIMQTTTLIVQMQPTLLLLRLYLSADRKWGNMTSKFTSVWALQYLNVSHNKSLVNKLKL